MKNILIFIAFFAFMGILSSQTMNLNKKDGSTESFNLSEIENITFSLTGGWSDDFEGYAAGTFPSSNWTGSGYGYLPDSYIDNSKSYSGSQSLKLYGIPNGNWAAIASRPLLLSPPFSIELFVFNGSETIGPSPHFTRCAISFRTGQDWVGTTGRSLFYFYWTGEIYGISSVIGTYATGVWYKVKMSYEITNANKIKVSYWLNDNFITTQEADIFDYESDLKNFWLEVAAGSGWYDNVKILK